MTTDCAGRAPRAGDLRVRTTSAAATRSLAALARRRRRAGDRIALLGPLGAGKTQFAKGFAVGLGVPDVVNSPSFTLMAEYHGRLPLFHQDLYRLAGAAEALEGGLLDERQDDGRDPLRVGRPARRAPGPGPPRVRFVLDEDEATRERRRRRG